MRGAGRFPVSTYPFGLVAEGHHLPNVLGQKAGGPYRRLEIGRWTHEELHLPVPLMQRPPILEERWEAQGQAMRDILFPEATE